MGASTLSYPFLHFDSSGTRDANSSTNEYSTAHYRVVLIVVRLNARASLGLLPISLKFEVFKDASLENVNGARKNQTSARGMMNLRSGLDLFLFPCPSPRSIFGERGALNLGKRLASR